MNNPCSVRKPFTVSPLGPMPVGIEKCQEIRHPKPNIMSGVVIVTKDKTSPSEQFLCTTALRDSRVPASRSMPKHFLWKFASSWSDRRPSQSVSQIRKTRVNAFLHLSVNWKGNNNKILTFESFDYVINLFSTLKCPAHSLLDWSRTYVFVVI